MAVMSETRVVELPDGAPTHPLSARRAKVGDRFQVLCVDVDGSEITAVVEATLVDRLVCGCDRVYTVRPAGTWPKDRMQLLPLGCYHDPADSDDYDAARSLAAGSQVGDQHE